ncbi:MAG TPA: type II and III secretion system protein family protein [Pyrinomonadaceae bacterium]|jgi:pilus assembly protein CpaC|nr:type II and III secretion system protein family protein [Pyrinomonadaceae bacterium]
MQTTRRLIPLIAALVGVILLGLPAAAHAQETSVAASFERVQQESIPINVLVGQSRVINFDRKIGRFSVSNPEVAEAVLVAPDQVLVNGKGFGQVNFIAWEKDSGKFLVFDVFVRANLSLIDSQIRALFPKDDIRLSQANGSVVISGSVKNPLVAQQAELVVKAAGFQTVNMLTSPAGDKPQVQLQVRVAEVSRTKAREIAPSYGFAHNNSVGYLNSGNSPTSAKEVSLSPFSSSLLTNLAPPLNLLLGNGTAGLTGFLRALKSVGAIRSLAEPNLIAMDGQQASFLAGGEFPVPIVQSGTDKIGVAIVWKEYGVRLNFKPTIIDEDHIRLELEPEVSTIDFANGVKFEGFLIPALKTRRAKTGVELRDGQSFALAGLLDNNETQTMSKVPGIGDLPIIGNLFKSKSFSKDETELMFFVTAQLVHPVSRDELPQMKGLDGLRGASPLGVEPKGEGIKGASGYSTVGDGAAAAASGEKADAAKADAKSAATDATVAPAPAAPQPAPAKDAVKEAPKVDATKAEATKTEASAAAAPLPVRSGANDLLLLTPSVARVAPPPNHQ